MADWRDKALIPTDSLSRIRLRRATATSLRVVYFLLGIAAILFWTYLFGHPILEGKIAGSDSGYALA